MLDISRAALLASVNVRDNGGENHRIYGQDGQLFLWKKRFNNNSIRWEPISKNNAIAWIRRHDSRQKSAVISYDTVPEPKAEGKHIIIESDLEELKPKKKKATRKRKTKAKKTSSNDLSKLGKS